ncbi:MAG TPA: hypothetical protein VFE47_03065 [Tepidisphaeraceae bacterium]|nr:hypothetical protein [Tepidisphaeraceae bacterium]
MQVQLKRPELQEFIDSEVRAGRFPSADAAIEAAVEQMMFDRAAEDIDNETAAAINLAEEQIDRGDGTDFHEFAWRMRQRFSAV